MNVADWVSRRGFRWVHHHQLIYNTCWEDPRLDRVALDLGPDDNVAMITSAGCNALDYALVEPKHIYAVDLNPRQNFLLELKRAGIKRLEHADFFDVFGRGSTPRFRELYHDAIREELAPECREYWDDHLHFFRPDSRRRSFYFYGTTGMFAWAINGYIDHVRHLRDPINALLAARDLEEQQAIYEASIRDEFWTRWLRWMIGRDWALWFLGVPRAQRRYLERTYEGRIADFVQDRLERVFAGLPLQDNYFWRVYLTGRYTPECCPEYLKPENFARLKAGLVDRISTHTQSLTQFLQSSPEPITRVVLLDHMDWLADADPAALAAEWQAIAESAPRSRILWRSGGTRTDFVDALQVRVGGRLRRVGEMLDYHRELADELHARDRVHTYGSFFVADMLAA